MHLIGQTSVGTPLSNARQQQSLNRQSMLYPKLEHTEHTQPSIYNMQKCEVFVCDRDNKRNRTFMTNVKQAFATSKFQDFNPYSLPKLTYWDLRWSTACSGFRVTTIRLISEIMRSVRWCGNPLPQ